MQPLHASQLPQGRYGVDLSVDQILGAGVAKRPPAWALA